MVRKIILHIFLLFFVSFVTLGALMAKTVVVNDAEGLIREISLLSDGDTLQLTSSEFRITSTLAPEGLDIASPDWSPYTGVSIIGAGMDSTVIDFSNSYGFFAYYSKDLLLKDLTIKKATRNGGIYIQSGEVNLENVKIDSCKSVLFSPKEEAHGGAVFYDANSTFSSIKNCIFSNNSAQQKGGALAYMNTTNLYSRKSYIENCQFYNNNSPEDTTAGGASAVYFEKIYSYVYLNQNVFFNNTNSPAIYVNAYNSSAARIYFKNNSVALNPAGGIEVGPELRSYLFLDNNAIVDNLSFDLKRNNSKTKYTGDFNVFRIAPDAAFVGYFNSIVECDRGMFVEKDDSLKQTLCGAAFLAGRISEDSKSEYDLYGNVCLTPADIGAINIVQGDSVAVWTGNANQDFFDSKNWKNEVVPTGSNFPSAVKKIIISDCNLNNYPIIPATITEANGGELSETDFRITATGIFENKGSITLDTLYVESQHGGTGQLLNTGTIINTMRFAEFYFASGLWTPVYIFDASLNAEQLLPRYTYGSDYEIVKYDENIADYYALSATDVFDLNQGYLVKTDYDLKAVLETSDNFNENFDITYTKQVDSLSTGWNLIANPYGASIDASDVLGNLGNDVAASGAIYTYDGARFKVWVDGIGDEEASIIAPRESFYVKALDQGNGVPVETSTFTLDADNIVLVVDEKLKSAEGQREGVLTVALVASNNVIYDETFLRFKQEASEHFDYQYDAVKMDRLEGITSSMIYTKSDEDVLTNYAVNTRLFASDAVLSVPICVDFVSSTLLKALNLKLKFSILGGDSISYLLHDALKDSIQSIELVNNTSVSFSTGVDSLSLLNRFSLQVFDGEIPDEIVSVGEREGKSVSVFVTERPEILFSIDTVSFRLRGDTLMNNSDTTFVVNYMVDSIYVDSFFVKELDVDSVFLDTTYADTTRLWGTYEYLETDVMYSSASRQTTEVVHEDTVSGVYWEDYILYDTILVTAINPVKTLENITVFSDGQYIHVSSSEQTNMNVKVFSMSGLQILSVVLPSGAGVVRVPVTGVYIVCAEQGSKLMNEKIIIYN